MRVLMFLLVPILLASLTLADVSELHLQKPNHLVGGDVPISNPIHYGPTNNNNGRFTPIQTPNIHLEGPPVHHGHLNGNLAQQGENYNSISPIHHNGAYYNEFVPSNGHYQNHQAVPNYNGNLNVQTGPSYHNQGYNGNEVNYIKYGVPNGPRVVNFESSPNSNRYAGNYNGIIPVNGGGNYYNGNNGFVGQNYNGYRPINSAEHYYQQNGDVAHNNLVPNYNYFNENAQPTYTHSQNLVNRPVAVPVPKPYPIPVNQPQPVPVPVPHRVEIIRKIPQPYPQHYPVHVPKQHPVHINRPVPIEVPYPVHVVVNQPVPIFVKQPSRFYLPGY